MSRSFYHSLLVFLKTEYLCFSFLTYFYPILCKNNFFVSRIFLPGHVNEHSKLLIYETTIFNIFYNFKKFLTIFNSSSDYNWGSEFSSYKIKLWNRVTQNDVAIRVTNSKIFVEILLSSYQFDFVKY